MIEIPKGDDRRRHYNTGQKRFVDLGAIKDVIPVNGGLMPVDYGFFPGTLNKEEGDEIDVLVLTEKKLKVGEKMEVWPIALIEREDGDDKIVAVDDTCRSIKDWAGVPADLRKLIKEFFSHHSCFRSIRGAEQAKLYIEKNLV